MDAVESTTLKLDVSTVLEINILPITNLHSCKLFVCKKKILPQQEKIKQKQYERHKIRGKYRGKDI